MALNYHELTMNEPRDSPARRKQYLVICTIGAAFCATTLLNSGMLLPLEISEGVFPGGNFCYKLTARDYAATPALLRSVAKDLELKNEDWDDYLYTVHLDDESKVSSGKQRFAGGILAGEEGQDARRHLMETNASKQVLPREDVSVTDLFEKGLVYEEADLPSVDAAVLQFPFTNGFVSALIHSFKVFPGLLKYAREHGEEGNVPVIVTTCSIKQSMCSHYVPLVQGEKFFLGRPTTEKYAGSFEKEDLLDFGLMWKGVKKLFWRKRYNAKK